MTNRPLAQPPGRFRAVAQAKLADERMQVAVGAATARLRDARLDAWGGLEGLDALRTRAHEIRMKAVRDLDRYVDDFTAAVEARGGHVHLCATGEEACATVLDICRRADARLVAKSKSMTTEEIGLNRALEAAGLTVVETDLGEYILQCRGDPPVHIVLPAIEKTKEEVAELFSQLEGEPVAADTDVLTAVIRRRLRRVFLEADVGITGANFLVAETGTVVTVTNEGNGRLVASLPRVHVAITGIERLVPQLEDLAPLLELLARSATGQPLSSYTHLVTGPRRPGEEDGPEELHVVLVENGRRNLIGTRYEEMLACIRCGACLNVCPVYRHTAGSAYGPVYSGPMGAVLAPLLAGVERAASLPHASSLCGACTEACPVRIPLHDLLLELRRDLAERDSAPRLERLAMTVWSLAWSTPLGYRVSTRLARAGQRLAGLAGPGARWRQGRDLPGLARRRFRDGRG